MQENLRKSNFLCMIIYHPFPMIPAEARPNNSAPAEVTTTCRRLTLAFTFWKKLIPSFCKSFNFCASAIEYLYHSNSYREFRFSPTVHWALIFTSFPKELVWSFPKAFQKKTNPNNNNWSKHIKRHHWTDAELKEIMKLWRSIFLAIIWAKNPVSNQKFLDAFYDRHNSELKFPTCLVLIKESDR